MLVKTLLTQALDQKMDDLSEGEVAEELDLS